jgi:hypothetical protein
MVGVDRAIEFNHRQQGKRGDGIAVSLLQNLRRAIDNTVKEETAMPFPYPKIVLPAMAYAPLRYECNHRQQGKRGDGNAVSLPQNVLRAMAYAPLRYEFNHHQNIHL